MPTIFLSPSTQQNNLYVIGESEEYYMNRLADAMEPYLRSTGIRFTRNNPDETVSQAIAQSNTGDYDLHVALHSNAAGSANAGQVRGIDIYYFPGSAAGQRAADIIAENFKRIYPLPDRVRTVPTTTLAEVVRTRAPAILAEIGYHDNPEDAAWIRDNIPAIARNLVQSLAAYFDMPFIEAQDPRTGTVDTARGNLNLRNMPSMGGDIIGSIPSGAAVQILGRWQDWYVVDYNGQVGYASSRYIRG